jgi:Cof subfamily protein (haloacid dehalogenase superfamily)
MDGTLLDSNHEVSNLVFELFKEIRKHNILFVVASGRPYYSIIEKLNSIKNDIIIVAENGAIVLEKDNTLLSTPLKKDNLIEIEKLVDKHEHIHVVFCAKSKAYFKKTSNTFIELLPEYYPNHSVINSLSDIKEEVLKIALYNDEDSEKNIYPLFKYLEPNYKVKVSGKNWLDISHDLANKGYALELIKKKHNINSDQIMAFGDYNNDIEMLKLATYSFAMENAHQNVKDITNYETKSNNDFGVELILEKLIAAKNNS